MKNMQRIQIIISVLFIAGCATTRVPVTTDQTVLFIPPGVDSLVAAEAQEIAEGSFVSMDAENKSDVLKQQARRIIDESDSLWKYLTMNRDTVYDVTSDNVRESIDAFNRGAEAIVKFQEISKTKDFDDAYLLTRQKELLDSAQHAFENAITLNPFDPETRYWLAAVYQRKAARLAQEREYRKAIEILERLIRVEKGDHPIYARLAESYYAIGKWTQAVDNFYEAERLLRETSFLNTDSAESGLLSAADSSTLFLYTYYRAEALTNANRPDDALETFRKAYTLTHLPTERQAVQSMIRFIMWDDGNIPASMARDSLLALRRDGKIADAERGFIILYDNLTTQRARDEIDWRIAVIHFEMDRKGEAADRLMRLVQRTETLAEDGMPVDSTSIRYFQDYGTICFNLGTIYLRHERDRHTALKYFKQAASVPWSNRALANFEVAKILINNIPEALRHSEAAIREMETMSTEEQRELYQVLVQLYRRGGNTERARYYFEQWRNI